MTENKRPAVRDRRDSAVNEIGGDLDQQMNQRLRNFVADRVFFLEDLNKGDQIPNLARSELVRLCDAVRDMARPTQPVQARPIYDLLILAVQRSKRGEGISRQVAGSAGTGDQPKVQRRALVSDQSLKPSLCIP